MSNPARPAYVLPTQFPAIPEPAASTWCHRCSWVIKDGSFKLKFIHRGCWHSRYLDKQEAADA